MTATPAALPTYNANMPPVRVCTYNELSTHDMVRINANLEECSTNYEGMTCEDCKTSIFVFIDKVFLVLDVHKHRKGNELFVTWLGGLGFTKLRFVIRDTLKDVAKQNNCRWLGGTIRRRKLQHMYRSIGIELDSCFMVECDSITRDDKREKESA